MNIESKQAKAGVGDVARALWKGISFYKTSFFISATAFVVSGILNVFIPLYYKRFFDLLSESGDKAIIIPQLVEIIFLILFLHIVFWLIFRIGMIFLIFFEAKVMARLKQISFAHTIYHSYSFFSDNFTGSLVQKINRFSRAFERLFDTFSFNFIPLLVQIVGTIIIVYFEQKVLALIIVIWILVVMIWNYIFSRWKLKYDLALASADSNTTALLADTITNQYAVTTFAKTEEEIEAFNDISEKQAQAANKTWQIGSSIDAVQGALWVAIEFFIFYYAIKYWDKGLIGIGTFVMIQAYIISLAQRLWDFGRIIRNIYESYADSEEMVRILNLPHEINDYKKAQDIIIKKGNIVFDNVSFAFSNKKPVLENISLKIKGGEKIALVGPSGAGKSTIVRLILRLYNLKQGIIKIDGQDVQKVTLNSLRQSISVVPQDPVLFHRSLMENIRYGRKDASDTEVIEAAHLAHCDDFIDKLPAGYETLVGERGIKLSGGERQRIAIARAILKNAPILILDEATSSLDSHSEFLIRDALDKLMVNKTTIVIAHRLSTIRKMDRIIVLDRGKITEEGTHDDLLIREKSLYKHLWELQAGGFLRT